MAQVVRQPSGRYALWTNHKDGIVVYDATEAEMVEYLTRGARQQAEAKVARAAATGSSAYDGKYRLSWDEVMVAHRLNNGGDPVRPEAPEDQR